MSPVSFPGCGTDWDCCSWGTFVGDYDSYSSISTSISSLLVSSGGGMKSPSTADCWKGTC